MSKNAELLLAYMAECVQFEGDARYVRYARFAGEQVVILANRIIQGE